MKKRLLYLSLVLAFTFIAKTANAQLLIEENFDYTIGDPLIAGAVDNVDNSATSTTGWLTVSASGSKAGTNSFTIADTGLSYLNYIGSGKGKALNLLDNDGQDVFKVFCTSNTDGAPFAGPKTLYFAYMVKIPAGNTTGEDIFAAIKYSAGASDANYFARTLAKVTDNEVKFGFMKSSSPVDTAWSNNYSINDTHLIVLKYALGDINGATSGAEVGNFDDVVDMFIVPVVGAAEPSTPTMRSANPNDKDAYRWNSGSTKILGGLAAFCLKTPAVGKVPALTFDGLRIGNTWSEVVASPTGLKSQTVNNQVKTFINQKQIIVELGNSNFNKYEIYNTTGATVNASDIRSNSFNIDASNLNNGVYILRFIGATDSYSTKISLQ